VLTLLGGAHAAWFAERFPDPTGTLGALALRGASAAQILVVLTLAAVLALPVAALVRGVLRVVLRLPRPDERVVDTLLAPRAPVRPPNFALASATGVPIALPPSPALLLSSTALAAPAATPAFVTRRAFVSAVTAAVPLGAAALAARGFVDGAAATELRVVPMPIPGLPAALDGLSILQLSDLHLGTAKKVDDLAAFLDSIAGRKKPDLVVLTGDVTDDEDALAPALRMLAALAPRLGVLATLGNHEYFCDMQRIRAIYDASDVRLLVDEGVTLHTGAGLLHVAGVDDPVDMKHDIRPWLERRVHRTLASAPSNATHLLLSHRPEAFDTASALGVDLTLSGHTHGGQVGYNGKSAFQPLFKDGYLWGAYQKNRARLYTTSGFGHWYPFRLGCKTEAPLVILTRD
jgi:predicted MPP superfamily phosphohydrolase